MATTRGRVSDPLNPQDSGGPCDKRERDEKCLHPKKFFWKNVCIQKKGKIFASEKFFCLHPNFWLHPKIFCCRNFLCFCPQVGAVLAEVACWPQVSGGSRRSVAASLCRPHKKMSASEAVAASTVDNVGSPELFVTDVRTRKGRNRCQGLSVYTCAQNRVMVDFFRRTRQSRAPYVASRSGVGNACGHLRPLAATCGQPLFDPHSVARRALASPKGVRVVGRHLRC